MTVCSGEDSFRGKPLTFLVIILFAASEKLVCLEELTI